MKLNLQSQSYSCEVQTQTDDFGGVLCYPLLSASQGASNDGWGLSFRYAHVTREPDKKMKRPTDSTICGIDSEVVLHREGNGKWNRIECHVVLK